MTPDKWIYGIGIIAATALSAVWPLVTKVIDRKNEK